MAKRKTFIANQYSTGYISRQSQQVRLEVFVNEQEIPLSLELDDKDDDSWHFVKFVDDIPISTARVFIDNEKTLHIGRVATLKKFRGKGFSSEIISEINRLALNREFEKLFLSAQISAKSFYEKLGFNILGDEYLEAGIEHIDMIKEVPRRLPLD